MSVEASSQLSNITYNTSQGAKIEQKESVSYGYICRKLNVSDRILSALKALFYTVITVGFAIHFNFKGTKDLWSEAFKGEKTIKVLNPSSPPMFPDSNEIFVGRHPTLGYKIYNPKGVGLLYQMTESLLKVFEKHNFKAWGIGGTILGAERFPADQKHGGHIPWDDDEDFAVIENENERLINNQAFLDDLDKAGLCLRKFFFGYKVCSKEKFPYMHETKANSEGDSYYWPFIDLFAVERDENDSKKWILSSKDAREYWPTEYYRDEELYDENGSLKMTDYGPIRIPLPVNGKKILDRAYPKWETHGKTGWDDATKRLHKGADKLIILHDYERQAAHYVPEPAWNKPKDVET